MLGVSRGLRQGESCVDGDYTTYSRTGSGFTLCLGGFCCSLSSGARARFRDVSTAVRKCGPHGVENDFFFAEADADEILWGQEQGESSRSGCTAVRLYAVGACA